jgi:hypothetical protein
MKILFLTVVSTCISLAALAQGRVSFVIGSDTGIWTGLDVSDYHCTISGALYTDPTMNAATVMDPGFRSALTDMYGTPMKLTWWMMAGNMFRLAVNTDVPVPSTMPIHLMKRFHGDRLRQWGDELTFHFHNWVWTDYDGDGKWYWNQAKTYNEFVPDFDQTLAELLLEEEVFPVSYRSGWHAMNNEWQQRLDRLLPYSMHNDWPAVHDDPVEPIDNVYDWSRAPSTFVPFRPSTTDYQVPGNGRGWNVRSVYITAADSAFVSKIFAEATKGIDQVVCLWAHLPETDFPANLQKVNRAIHAAASRYPAIGYRYCTAVEAMQSWRRTTDTTAPHLTVQEITSGPDLYWTVQSAKTLFQPEPFLAVKDRYERYTIVPMQNTGLLRWTTTVGIPRSDIARMGVAATDIVGNHTIVIERYLPDDIFVDEGDAGYREIAGTWQTTKGTGFGASIRTAAVHVADSAKVRWEFSAPAAGPYNLYLRVPAVPDPVTRGRVEWARAGQDAKSTAFAASLPTDAWNFIGTLMFDAAGSASVEVTAYGTTGTTVHLAADALKVSALVRDRWIEAPEAYDAGSIIIGESNARSVSIDNSGILPAQLLSAHLVSGTAEVSSLFPITVPAMGEAGISLLFIPPAAASFVDTLVVTTDDPHHTTVRIAVHATVREYYAIVDDGNALSYAEAGAWSFSTAGGFNSTSRYAYPAAGVSATFMARLKRTGVYEISEIVPTTVNASVRARYSLFLGPALVDSVFKDQNEGSGNWVALWSRSLPADSAVTVRITDAMSPVVSGKVLRADAIQFQWVSAGPNSVAGLPDGVPSGYVLSQNFPNPFNPATTIRFSIADPQFTTLKVYDMLGREVALLVNEQLQAGYYAREFNGEAFSSGVYFCRLQTGGTVSTIKMLYAK